MKFRSFLLAFCVAGMLAAQTPATPQSAPASHARRAKTGMVQRLSARLNLTPDQQNQARAIFRQSRADASAFAPKLREERVALQAAVKSDNEAQIDRILSQNSQWNAQARANHAKAMAKFYQILTPAQRAQFDKMGAHRMGRRPAQSAGESR